MKWNILSTKGDGGNGERKKYQPRILYPVKFFFKSEAEIKTRTNKTWGNLLSAHLPSKNVRRNSLKEKENDTDQKTEPTQKQEEQRLNCQHSTS